MNLTTLGWLKHLEDPAFQYFEWQYQRQILRFLTQRWWLLQGGSDDQALQELLMVFKVLELDNKAKRDLMLLAQTGFVGRAHANKILWAVLSGPALDTSYQDLSNLVTQWVYKARRDFDRPPREHGDLSWWWWTCFDDLYRKDKRWGPDQIPTTRWILATGPGGRPLPPPQCWGQPAPR